ncbi:MAG: GGDEF domain-containing protein [Tenericutes bacterium]|nr:GGDEF domain-containing protein [Mycoplasmatota bacterium]
MKTKVLLREENIKIDVLITNEFKPEIPLIIRERWQKVISLVADILEVPAGLIMKITPTHMEVFLKSQNKDNPYPEDGMDNLLHGLYCETVIGRDEALHVDNSLQYDAWKTNPDVELNMISYYGLPIKWNDGSFFGTICTLDNKTNQFRDKYKELLLHFKDIIEQDLTALENTSNLEEENKIDELTQILNRRGFNDIIKKYFKEYNESNELFSLIMIDLDHFKYINDHYGHVTGDRLLVELSKTVSKELTNPDIFSRFGGDEFVYLTKSFDIPVIVKALNRIKEIIYINPLLKKYGIDFSYGIAVVNEKHRSVESLIEEADRKLYLNKETKQN